MRIKIILVITSTLALSRGQDLPLETYSNTRKFPSVNVCGKPFLNVLKTVIFGGQRSNLGAHPWMANIGYKDQNNWPVNPKWMCGGTLITDRHILTAAHCLTPETMRTHKWGVFHQWKPIAVQLGDLDTNTTADGAEPKVFHIDKYIWHEKYNNTRHVNDIGLITLKSKVEFKDLIRPICLPSASLYQKLFVGENLTVAGWGMNENGIYDTHLLEVDVPVHNLNDCKRKITTLLLARKSANVPVIDANVICAGSLGKDACQGDSGGPLMYLDRKETPNSPVGTWYQIGIVSYGIGCGMKGLPGVYMRVSQYMRWIDANVKY